MARRNRTSASREKNIELQNIVHTPSPTEVLDTTDPGDETQQQYRYQHAYGVILLAASIRHKQPYVAIWCEHHEDFLGEHSDGLYDAYQIKTQQPEMGSWHLAKVALKDSIKRFVKLEVKYPSKIKQFYFVSNVRYENSKAKDKIKRNAVQLLESVQKTIDVTELSFPFNEIFEELQSYCECSSSSLITVLRKLKLVHGPDLDGFEAVVAQDHLSKIKLCNSLSARALANLRDNLIAQVYKASSCSSDDPSRHWCCIYGEDHLNPKLLAKRISVESVIEFINETLPSIQSISKESTKLGPRLRETLKLSLNHSFKEDQFARLDQAGETDTDRSTLLREVFVDLELKPRNNPPPYRITQGQLRLFEDVEQTAEITKSLSDDKLLSAMHCLLRELSPMIVIIGGPGQGKSTLGQYLAQVHRAKFLNCEKDLYRDVIGNRTPQKKFSLKKRRIPFRIVLKYFAQWLSDGPNLSSVESYIAEQIGKEASRPGEMSASDVQEILKVHETLIIFDGLDEVMEPKLRGLVLTRLEEFMEATTLLNADIQVLATSRPTGYSYQFDPKQYWHLELQPMSKAKIQEYVSNWTEVKVVTEEERRRVKDTLEECLKEDHTRLLLTTPLQVSIVLIIIKNGGRPPAQREALFQDYWNTILRREKSKDKNIIRTDDAMLFNLHAYLGYILHRKSVDKNVRSLLPVEEFEVIVYRFLKRDDIISDEETLRELAMQMVKEARTRLVLLVEPEPGFFGFELRSLQEFFAGVYLAQTACDTNQRFERFKAISRSEHWRNVALFFAGQIVRNFKGEAAYILDRVCQQIDLDPPDFYLRPGALLALDIATDGVFASNRNLQSKALEYAFTIIYTGITSKNSQYVESALLRLSFEDRRDILIRLFKRALTSVPLSCLPMLLNTYARSIGVQQDFIQGLETLLYSGQDENIQKAIDLGFRHEVAPSWLATQIEKHMIIDNTYKENFLWSWWQTYPIHTQKVLNELSLTKVQAHVLSKRIGNYRHHRRERSEIKLIRRTDTFSNQLIILLQCLDILSHIENYRISSEYRQESISEEYTIRYVDLEQSYTKRLKIWPSLGLSETLDQLIRCSNLLPQLKIYLWLLYWKVHEPTDSMVTAFLDESEIWTEDQGFLMPFLEYELERTWPLLSLLLKKQIERNYITVKHLQPYLGKSQQIAIGHQIYTAISLHLQKLSNEERNNFVKLLKCKVIENLPDLIYLSEELKLDISDINELVYFYTYVIAKDTEHAYSTNILKEVFLSIKHNLSRTQYIQQLVWSISYERWLIDDEIIKEGKHLLTFLIEMLPHHSKIIQGAVNIFFKLLAFDHNILQFAPSVLKSLAALKRSIWIYSRTIENISLNDLNDLANFIKDEDKEIQEGAFNIWDSITEAILTMSHASSGSPFSQMLNNVRLDWQPCLPLLKDKNTEIRKRGIKLLTFSDFPITDKLYRDELRSAIAKANNIDEINAWVRFFNYIPIVEDSKHEWLEFLKIVLSQTQIYTTRIITATIDRYDSLVNNAGPDIIGDELALGLSIVPTQELYNDLRKD